MPGFLLHLTAAQMFLKSLSETDPLRLQSDLQNAFYIGNLLPDTASDKTRSHFRNPEYLDRMIVFPQPEKFREKYRERMGEPLYLGYYLHLYIDKVFLSRYLPEIAEYLDSAGCENEFRKNIQTVRLKKSGELIPIDRYLSDEYYYGDYTKMSTWLCHQYHLPESLQPIFNTGISEADDLALENVLSQIKTYRQTAESAVNDLRVFDLQKLLNVLETETASCQRIYLSET